ncbi:MULTISPECIES: pyridoxamine 5'-phosphate oxidase family protein [unclassified Psychrobacter]|uniref:pyridoxamine 5'-phosphate oxidase family protein n=1 Tax=unclassified Psychrobacter TaxID=196806 RepID=UPI00078B9DC6|nr:MULTISPECIES: pyridoxamine 5'-phosphate oxidase family protein [unclassified Psychrobacter]AMN48694.1 general stress protein [Psychrobacter sp. P2G3]AMN66517.1 general stress protein [Psychrobacter sp. P11G5]
MSKQEQMDKLQAMVNDIKYTMMTTRTHEDHLHSCPMNTTETSIGAKEIWFIGHSPSETVDNIKKNPEVNLAYVSQDDKNYLSITGKAELVEDKEKLDELWSVLYNAYFEQGKEDPKVQLIKVVPHGAEYWANGNAIASAFKMTAAAVTDTAIEKSLGENFSIEL